MPRARAASREAAARSARVVVSHSAEGDGEHARVAHGVERRDEVVEGRLDAVGEGIEVAPLAAGPAAVRDREVHLDRRAGPTVARPRRAPPSSPSARTPSRSSATTAAVVSSFSQAPQASVAHDHGLRTVARLGLLPWARPRPPSSRAPSTWPRAPPCEHRAPHDRGGEESVDDAADAGAVGAVPHARTAREARRGRERHARAHGTRSASRSRFRGRARGRARGGARGRGRVGRVCRHRPNASRYAGSIRSSDDTPPPACSDPHSTALPSRATRRRASTRPRSPGTREDQTGDEHQAERKERLGVAALVLRREHSPRHGDVRGEDGRERRAPSERPEHGAKTLLSLRENERGGRERRARDEIDDRREAHDRPAHSALGHGDERRVELRLERARFAGGVGDVAARDHRFDEPPRRLPRRQRIDPTLGEHAAKLRDPLRGATEPAKVRLCDEHARFDAHESLRELIHLREEGVDAGGVVGEALLATDALEASQRREVTLAPGRPAGPARSVARGAYTGSEGERPRPTPCSGASARASSPARSSRSPRRKRAEAEASRSAGSAAASSNAARAVATSFDASAASPRASARAPSPSARATRVKTARTTSATIAPPRPRRCRSMRRGVSSVPGCAWASGERWYPHGLSG